MSTCNLNQLKAEACANHFSCLDENTARAVESQLLCNLTGMGYVTGGNGAPTTTPTVAFQIYINTANNTQYNWYNSAWHIET